MPQPTAGFTLFETLIAFAITALALAGMVPIILDTAARAERSSATRVAIMLAESKLAALGSEQPLETGEGSGSFDARYRWTTQIGPFRLLSGGAEPNGDIYEVIVNVIWGEDVESRSVTLRTLRIAPKRQAAQ